MAETNVVELKQGVSEQAKVDSPGKNGNGFVLPFDELTKMFRAMLTKNLTSGLSKYHHFLEELGAKESVDTLVNDCLKKGLATTVRYQATLIRNNIGDKAISMQNDGIDAANIARFVETHGKIHDALLKLAESITKGTA